MPAYLRQRNVPETMELSDWRTFSFPGDSGSCAVAEHVRAHPVQFLRQAGPARHATGQPPARRPRHVPAGPRGRPSALRRPPHGSRRASSPRRLSLGLGAGRPPLRQPGAFLDPGGMSTSAAALYRAYWTAACAGLLVCAAGAGFLPPRGSGLAGREDRRAVALARCLVSVRCRWWVLVRIARPDTSSPCRAGKGSPGVYQIRPLGLSI